MNNIIKTLIVDDEPDAREGLAMMLSEDNEIEIIGICKNGIEAVQYLKEKKVDLLFLDIHMPGINGFEVLDLTEIERWPFIVFVTAYDDYAIRAFEYHALDYLLKPFSDDRFRMMLDRAKKSVFSKRQNEQSEKYEKLKSELFFNPGRNSGEYINNISDKGNLVLKDSGKIIMVPPHEISCIEAFDYYIKIFHGRQVSVIRSTIKKIITLLPEKHFIRVHRSYIVNTDYIQSLERKTQKEVVLLLRTGKMVRVSASYKKILMERMKPI